MCCILCCCCDYCNRYTSRCMEFFILIISFLTFGFTIIGFFYIDKDHLTLICFIVFIALIVFSFLILLSIILIVIWRYKESINNKRHKPGEAFSIIGIVITILYMICLVSLVSMMHSHYQEMNHPCSNIERNENDIKARNNTENTDNIDNPPLPSQFEEDKEDFCIEHPDYNIHIIQLKEFIIVYSFAGILLIFMFLLIYAWFNVYRRIKFLIDGTLNDFDAQEVKKEDNNLSENSNDKRINERINKKENQLNNKHLYKIYSQQEYGIRYDIYGRPIIKIHHPDNKAKNNMHNINTSRFSKRKSILNNRVNVYKNRNSIKPGKSVTIEVGHSNSSDRTEMNKFQFSRNKPSNNNNIVKSKTTTNANLVDNMK